MNALTRGVERSNAGHHSLAWRQNTIAGVGRSGRVSDEFRPTGFQVGGHPQQIRTDMWAQRYSLAE